MVLRAQLMENLRQWDEAKRLATEILDKKKYDADEASRRMVKTVLDNVAGKQP